MISLDKEAIIGAVAGLPDPWMGSPIGEIGWQIDLGRNGESWQLRVRPGYPLRRSLDAYVTSVRACLGQFAGSTSVGVVVDPDLRKYPVQPGALALDGIGNILAVASGKGGVGKSTAAVNLALALADEGARVGLLDADIYGPSQPRMLGISGRARSTDGNRLVAFSAFGIRVMSAGFLVDSGTPMVWRGPMVTQALIQLLTQTEWGELDYLVVDLPPGTGDVQLTIAQKVPVAGAVIVTTPQQVAVADARKGLAMFRKVEVEILGILENMSSFRCPHCGEVSQIFGRGGAAELAKEAGVPILGQIMLDPRILEDSDAGRPSLISNPTGENASAWREFALRTAGELSIRINRLKPGPKITLE